MLPEPQNRMELFLLHIIDAINGEDFTVPLPRNRHEVFMNELAVAIQTYVNAHKGV